VIKGIGIKINDTSVISSVLMCSRQICTDVSHCIPKPSGCSRLVVNGGVLQGFPQYILMIRWLNIGFIELLSLGILTQ
jgi:hypothetical protein